MNRTIKFRGKRKDNNEWVYGNLIIGNNYNFIITDEDTVVANLDTLICQCHPIEKDNKTLGQFTGFYDKNGKEIYEGDIVIDMNNNKTTIKWCDAGFCFMAGEFVIDLTSYLTSTIEIIGNVYDNGELLNED